MQLFKNTLISFSLISGLFHARIACTKMSHVRSYFYVGGEYINTAAGHVLQNQMYVEKLTPSAGSTKPYPIVFIHGGGQTGTASSPFLFPDSMLTTSNRTG